MKKLAIIIITIVSTYGCATAPHISTFTPEDLASRVKITSTEFDTHIKLVGLSVGNTISRGLLPETEKYCIRSWLGKGDDHYERHQLYYAVSYYGDWRFYRGANFKDGKTVNTVQISRDVLHCSSHIGCNLSEAVGVPLTRDDIEKGAVNGLTIRINTRYTNLFSYVTLPANYFQGYLIALEVALER